MEKLKNCVILYDGVCPMCSLYTNAFVKSGMLEKEGRATYQDMPAELKNLVDGKRAVDEIALVNIRTGAVTYGIESLFKIILHSFPVFRPLFHSPAFTWLAGKAYKFVSFNRRVIMPSYKGSDDGPSFHAGYRLVYLLFAWLVTSFLLSAYSRHLTAWIPAGSFYRELLVCGGQIIWQLLFVLALQKNKAWDYLGNMMSLSFGGALLLLKVHLIAALFSITNPVFYAAAFFAVVCLMLSGHIRRTRLLGLSWLLTATWVLYRLLILFILL